MQNVDSKSKSSNDDEVFEHLVGQVLACIDEGIDGEAKTYICHELEERRMKGEKGRVARSSKGVLIRAI